MSLKHAFFGGMLVLWTSVSAQNADSQSIVDTTNNSLYINNIDTSNTETMLAEDYVSPIIQKNTLPTFENPRNNSLIYLLQHKSLVEGFYQYTKNTYLQVKFTGEGKNSRIVVKMYRITEDNDDFGWWFATDRIVLDSNGKYLPRNPYPEHEANSFQSFLVSTPISFIGVARPVFQSPVESEM